jgi:hypothetical protein
MSSNGHMLNFRFALKLPFRIAPPLKSPGQILGQQVGG